MLMALTAVAVMACRACPSRQVTTATRAREPAQRELCLRGELVVRDGGLHAFPPMAFFLV